MIGGGAGFGGVEGGGEGGAGFGGSEGGGEHGGGGGWGGLEDIREKAKMAAEVDAVARAPAGIAASEAEQGALVEVDWAAAR
jgi:hypothetical protein